MGKSRIEGIENLIKSTTKVSSSEKLTEEFAKVLFEVPATLKKEMNVYCAMNDITLKDFITGAIKKELK
ncbi:hypothetical protein EZS27_031777 [termite gut metagenome]|uniref:Uncharacterized protein n=1 Tax=termite gut metagenome TaxID=433724 RepID=A0A5J4QBT0_9ZZZZ